MGGSGCTSMQRRGARPAGPSPRRRRPGRHPPGRRVFMCRWMPKRGQVVMSPVDLLRASSPFAKSVSVGPTRTVVVRTPVPSSSIASARAATSIAAFVAPYPSRPRSRRAHGVGRDEHDVAGAVARSSSGSTRRVHRNGPSRFVRISRLELLRRQLPEGAGHRDPGVVHQDVDRSEPVLDRRHERIDRRSIGHVEAAREHLAARVDHETGGLVELVGAAGAERHRPARARRARLRSRGRCRSTRR